MHDFCELYWNLDSTNRTNGKVKALKHYFESSSAEDCSWATYLLVGNRIKRLVPTKRLRQWAIEKADIPAWLFEECYERVGDLAETVSLVLPRTESNLDAGLAALIENRLLPLRSATEQEQKRQIVTLWDSLNTQQIFVLGKLITGGFRVGVSKRLVTRSISEWASLDPAVVAHRLMGNWEPTAEFFETVISADQTDDHISKPYPFFLANPVKETANPDHPVDLEPAVKEWHIEWKWDGIRAQLIRRSGQTLIWSRGEELITDQFPEVQQTSEQLDNGTVLDGELVAWSSTEERPQDFNQLQRRLGRRKLGKKLLAEVPVVFLAFDQLELKGIDIRDNDLSERKRALSNTVANLQAVDRFDHQPTLFEEPETPNLNTIRLPPEPEINDSTTWPDIAQIRNEAKSIRAEGLMLKRMGSPYRVGRPIGDWWKWKVEPYTIDAVLVYAQRGHGKRANLYSDYTFAVWKSDELVPFAKAYSGLTDSEIKEVDSFIKKNTLEKFGPVRSVNPELVFELAFENVQRSTRHKSGIAVRFPRISRWRHDKRPQDADSLETILQGLENE